jgi:hypothetical protein
MRRFAIAERLLTVSLTGWHSYVLEWQPHAATFFVDGQMVLEAPSPRGPLGLVIWLDNQYLVAHPSGRLRYGLVAKAEMQWLEIADLHL